MFQLAYFFPLDGGRMRRLGDLSPSRSWMGVIFRCCAVLDRKLTPIQLRLASFLGKATYPSPIKGEERANLEG
jgi:hypothetical protein